MFKAELPTQMASEKGAVFSTCGHYRYLLWRHWDEHKPVLGFIGLNPSTADAAQDDPTIRRCRGFAVDLGFGGIVVANLFAYRASRPKDLFAAVDPVGEENRLWLGKLPDCCAKRVAIWGNHGHAYYRQWQFTAPVYCLKLNKSGAPAHPLYLPKGLRLKKFPC